MLLFFYNFFFKKAINHYTLRWSLYFFLNALVLTLSSPGFLNISYKNIEYWKLFLTLYYYNLLHYLFRLLAKCLLELALYLLVKKDINCTKLFIFYTFFTNCKYKYGIKIMDKRIDMVKFLHKFISDIDTDIDIDRADSEKLLLFKSLDSIVKIDPFLLLLDSIFSFFFSKIFKKNKNYNTINYNSKINSLTNRVFFLNNSFNFFSKTQLILFGLNSIWKHLRFWILPLSVSSIFLYYTFFLKSLPFVKVLFSYFIVINMFYLLISGFVFFFKKYQYRLYTTAIQRFWRRSLIIFWLIEVSLFTVFIYLTLNASQEPIHVYDNIQIYKTHFYSWRYFLIKIIPASLLIIFVYILLLLNKWNTFSKVNNIIFCITLLLFFIFWLEFYQFFYLLTCYGITEWVYDISEHLWNLETDFKRTRIVNHYVTICLIAKFWHIVFAVLFWIFFVLRGLESSRYRYPLLVSNLQNFLLIYIMSWLYMYPWFKYVFRKFLDLQYYWFFINNRKLGFFIFFNDIKLFYWGFLDLFYVFFENYNLFFKKNNLFYWYESSNNNSFINNTQFRKHNIRDFFIKNF